MKRIMSVLISLVLFAAVPQITGAFELDSRVFFVRDVFGTSHVPGETPEPGLNVEFRTEFSSVLSEQFQLRVQGERHTVTGNTLLARIHVTEGIFEFGVGATMGILNSLGNPAVPGFTALLRTNIGSDSFLQAELIESLGANGSSYGQVHLQGGIGVYNALVTVFYDNRRSLSDDASPVRRTSNRYGALIDVFKSGVPYGLDFVVAWRSESLVADGETDSLMGLHGGAGISVQFTDAVRAGLSFDTDVFLIGTENLAGTALNNTLHFRTGAFVTLTPQAP